MNRPIKTLYVVLFSLLLLPVSLLALANLADYRMPAKSSVLDGGLAKSIEQHYDEQFPLKQAGINLWAALEYLAFGEGRSGLVIGDGGWLAPRVTLYHDVRIGKRVVIQSGAVIGGEGFGFANEKGVWQKIAQIGGVTIGDDVEIGANTTVDRGALSDTLIGNGVKLDNQIMIAHNVQIGDNTAMAGCCGISGSTKIGRNCMIAGGVGMVGHIEVCDNVFVTGMTMVTRSITEAGAYSSGTAMQPAGEWKKSAARIRQLDEMAKRLRELEKQLAAVTQTANVSSDA